jgi:TPR repeat protein
VASIEIQQGPGSGLESPRAHGASTIAHLNDDEITALINHAKDFLRNGDFVSARLLLRRAAEAGSVDATLMLGETFDPLVMHERGAIGIAPDIAQATQWYEKAAKLGSDIATQRLAKLAQTGH